MVIYPGEITFSINENNSAFIENTLLIYPNPVKEQARLSFEVKKTSSLTLNITDLAGRTVFSRNYELLNQGQTEIIVPVNDLPAGLYQMILQPEDRVLMTQKFLKLN
jgi:hypothetical protein